MSDDREAPRPHLASGLDLARSMAASMRGVSIPRPYTRSRRKSSPTTPEVSGAHPDGRDPALIGSIVDKLVSERGWSSDVAVHGVFGRWSAIVGAEVAAHCTPSTYRDGDKVVEVSTDSTAWAVQLRLLAPTVVRRLNEELGDGTVARIQVHGPQAPSWRRGRRSVRGGRGPRDTYG